MYSLAGDVLAGMLDGGDRSTEWWQKAVVVPVRRAWVVVAARLRRKKHGKFEHLAGQPACSLLQFLSSTKYGCIFFDYSLPSHWTSSNV